MNIRSMVVQIWNYTSLYSGFLRVKENQGCAGVDGITIDNFEANLDKKLERLQKELIGQTNSPLPLLNITVDKGNDEARNY